MGDKISMKNCNILMFSALFMCSCAFADIDSQMRAGGSNLASINLQEYDIKFADLVKPRVGLSNEQISSLKNPFGIEEVGKTITVADDADIMGYKLLGVMENKIKINQKWYAIGDFIGSYQIVQINANSAIISNTEKKIELKMNQGNQNVIISYN